MPVDQRREYVVWDAPGGDLRVRIAASVIDRLNVDVMRGFGVTRRRGTETGGILIGRAEGTDLWVEDYEEVPCEYAYGPSYLLSDADRALFRQAVSRWKPAAAKDVYAIGYYRSHTRDGLRVEQSDADLFEQFFHSGMNVALLIRPFATKPGRASFFLPSAGRLTPGTESDEFPFTSQVGEDVQEQIKHAAPPTPVAVTEPKVVVPVDPAPPLPTEEPPPEPPPQPPPEPVPAPQEQASPILPPEPSPLRKPAEDDRVLVNVLGPRNHALDTVDRRFDRSAPTFGEYQRAVPKWKRTASWLAFALALFGFGFLIGFRYAGGRAITPAAPRGEPYSAGLSIERQAPHVLVRWDREADVLKAAQKGVLLISEPSGSKEVQLGAAELRNGTVIYQNAGPSTTFQLELFLPGDRRFVETATWRAPAEQ